MDLRARVQGLIHAGRLAISLDRTFGVKGIQRILRLIEKWLKARVSEDGQWWETNQGTPQGAVVSPLIANVYLHYVFDLWAEVWRRKVAKGSGRSSWAITNTTLCPLIRLRRASSEIAFAGYGGEC